MTWATGGGFPVPPKNRTPQGVTRETAALPPHGSSRGLPRSPLVGDATRAGHALLTPLVDDLDAQIAELAERGLTPSAIEIVPGVPRKAVFIDPEGNRLTFGQNPS